MHASRPSLGSSFQIVVLLAAASAIGLVVLRQSSVRAPVVDVAPPDDSVCAAPPPTCEEWALDMPLRAAMQTCSMWADLGTNERWLFSVRATIADHRLDDMTITQIDHDCAWCFADEAHDREDRARYTVNAVSRCMQEQLAAATFTDENCVFDTRWSIKGDW